MLLLKHVSFKQKIQILGNALYVFITSTVYLLAVGDFHAMFYIFTNLFAVAVYTSCVLRETLVGIRIIRIIKERLADKLGVVAMPAVMTATSFTHVAFLRTQTR